MRQLVAVVLGAVSGRGRRPVDLIGGKGVVHVAFLYGVCVSNTEEIVDQVFGKVKWVFGLPCPALLTCGFTERRA